MPSVDDVRPGQCPRCATASQLLGRGLGVRGHGVRVRQQRGPLVPDGPPQTVTVAVRRYRCTACRAILTVVPREVAPRKHYSAAAIAWALGLFGCEGLPLREVRRRTSPWTIVGATAAAGWTTLVRWIRAVRRRALFACVRSAPAAFTHRQVAARAATTLAAVAGPTVAADGLAAAAFLGAAQMA